MTLIIKHHRKIYETIQQLQDKKIEKNKIQTTTSSQSQKQSTIKIGIYKLTNLSNTNQARNAGKSATIASRKNTRRLFLLDFFCYFFVS